jgi:hypothetical protein
MMTRPSRPAIPATAAALAVVLAGVADIPVAVAQTVYKSVDAEGNVTYSSTPAPEAVDIEAVDVPEGPSDAERQEAMAREQALQKKAESLKQDLQGSQEQKSEKVDEAEERLAAAKERLEQARVKEESDWQTIAGEGAGRFLKESYFERVRKAEEDVRQAERDLAKARRDSR